MTFFQVICFISYIMNFVVVLIKYFSGLDFDMNMCQGLLWAILFFVSGDKS